MTDLQRKILEVYEQFRKICEENDLRYFAIGGTCIGAIRHHGFIPWDDDMDIALPLSDYEKFRKIVKENPPEHYGLFDWEERKHCRIKHLKFYDDRTTFIEEGTEEMPDRYTGVFIDIMPISGIPEDEVQQRKFLNKSKKILRFNVARRFEIKRNTTFKSKVFSIFVKPVIAVRPFNFYSELYEKHISQYEFGETNQVFFSWRIPLRAPYKNIFPYDLFAAYIEVPFENTKIRVPKGYDSYLKSDFGNYMQLPPEEKRHGGHPPFICDLNRSYRMYQEEE